MAVARKFVGEFLAWASQEIPSGGAVYVGTKTKQAFCGRKVLTSSLLMSALGADMQVPDASCSTCIAFPYLSAFALRFGLLRIRKGGFREGLLKIAIWQRVCVRISHDAGDRD